VWNFVLHTLAGTRIGELRNIGDRKVSLPLNRMATAGFTMNLENRYADRIIEQDCLVAVYETVGVTDTGSPDRRLRMVGDVTSAEEVVDGANGTVAVTISGGLFRLLKRLVGKAATGYSLGTALSLVDRGAIIVDMVNRVQSAVGSNVDAGGDAGIIIGDIQASSSTYVGPLFFAKVAEQIALLSTALDGFDFELAPLEPTTNGGKFWRLNIYAAKGSASSAIFEFGTGKKNVKGYKRPVTKDGIMNDGYMLPPGYPDTASGLPLHETDPASITQYGRFEDVVPSDIPVEQLRARLLQEHVRIRRTPRQQITFDPHINAPKYGQDFTLGDTVTFRAVRNGQVRVNAAFRVYGVDVAIDDVGRATTSITVIPD
jgi:hypothetical protein